jgi:uncharacterized membrane protein
MLRSPQTRRSLAAFYLVSIGVVVGVCCMTRICAMWVDDAAPDLALTALGIAGFLLATVAVLRDGRRLRPQAAKATMQASPPTADRR